MNYATGDGRTEISVIEHRNAKETRWWVTYEKVHHYAPVRAGTVIAKFASPGDAFNFARTVIDRIERRTS